LGIINVVAWGRRINLRSLYYKGGEENRPQEQSEFMESMGSGLNLFKLTVLSG